MNNAIKSFNLFLFLISAFLHLQGQDIRGESAQKVYKQYNAYDSVFVRESVYLHTGKNTFEPGEKLFFNAFVSDFKGRPLSFNRNLYVDFLTPHGNVMYSKRLFIGDKGSAAGYIMLEDSVLSGTYYLRAYTNSQRNFDMNYAYSKPVVITNGLSAYFIPLYFKELKKLRRKKDNIKFEYVVKGNRILQNSENEFLFRVSNYLGMPADAEIFIRDKEQDKEYHIETDSTGTAALNIFIDKQANLKIKVKTPNSRTRKRIRQKAEKGIKIADARLLKDRCELRLQSNLPETNDRDARTFVLLYRIPGKILAAREIFIGNKKNAEIAWPLPKADGYGEVLLTDIGGEIISRHAVYAPYEPPEISLNYTFGKDSVFFEIPEAGRLSVCLLSSSPNINNGFPDIKDYFLYRNRTKDLLNPFAKYNIFRSLARTKPQMLSSDLGIKADETPQYAPEKDISVSGTLYRSVFDITVPRHKVDLFVLDKHYDRFEAITDKDGKFSFENLNYEDTLKLRFVTKNNRGKKAFIIDVEDKPAPPFQRVFPDTISQMIRTARTGRNFYRRRKPYTNKKDSVANIPGKVHSNAGRVLFFDEINTDGYSSTLDVIESHVIGIRSDGMSTLRGYTSIMGSSEPMYMIDDVPTDKTAVRNLPPQTVDRVEILKGGSESAIYGIRAANGVIAVYTKSGHNWTPGELFLDILGYMRAKTHKGGAAHDADMPEILYFRSLAHPGPSDTLKFSVPKPNQDFVFDIQGFNSKGEPVHIQKKLRN